MDERTEVKFSKITSWRALNIRAGRDLIKEVGLCKIIWGTDIFINGVPMIKLMILANILMWVLLWVSRQGGR